MLTQLTAVSLTKPLKGQPAEWPVLINTEFIVAMWPHAYHASVTVIQMIKGRHVIGTPFAALRTFLGGEVDQRLRRDEVEDI